MTAEGLYIALSVHGEVVEELEEILVSTNWVEEGVGVEEGRTVLDLLRGQLLLTNG